MFTSSERLANLLKINVIKEVGKLVKKSEMVIQRLEHFLKKVETGDMRVEELVKIQMNASEVGKVRKSVRFVKRSTQNLSRMRCWQELERRIISSSALTISLERSCIGRL